MKNNTQHAAELYSAIMPFVQAFDNVKKIIPQDNKHHVDMTVRNTDFFLCWNHFEEAKKAAAAYQADHDNVVKLLERAEQFISGFQDDPHQEGINDLLIGLRAALVNKQGGAQ